MRLRIFGVLLSLSFYVGLPAMGQSAQFYPLELVKAGQKGVGKTVFEGTTIESFDVEILGVLRNFAPQQNLILARLSGEKLERTGVFQGMSGSPVYIDGRIVGAVAYAFNFSKEPIAGVTPIQEIVDVFRERPQPVMQIGERPSLRATDLQPVASLEESPLIRMNSRPEIPIRGPQLGLPVENDLLAPIATPLSLSGFSPQSIREFAPYLDRLGLSPVRGIGSGRIDGADGGPLQAGSTIAVQMVRGDMDVSAAGTVTHVSGNRVYAFGHPFLSIGSTDMPFHKASVLTVVPSVMSSQKLSAPMDFAGTIRQDRATGIMGLTGEKAKMIPVRLNLTTSRNELKEYRYEVVTDQLLTPFLMTFTVHSSIVASERAIGGQTLNVRCAISVRDHPTILFENSVSDLASSPVVAALSAAAPVNFLLNSGFDGIDVENIEIDITAVEQTREVVLERVWQDRLEVRRGEEFEVTLFLRKPNGEVIVERYPVRVPAEVPPGPMSVIVGDGLSIIREDALPDSEEFVPENLSQLIRAINNIKRNDRLYIRLYRELGGAVIGGEGLPNLPPSMLALYTSRKTAGEVRPINRVVYSEFELPATEFVLKGHKILRIQVKG